MRRKAAPLSRAEGFVGQSFAEHFIHCTCVWDMGQVPNQDAVPGVGLAEISLRRKGGNGTAAVTNPSHKTGHKRQKPVGDELTLTTRIRIQMPCDQRHLWPNSPPISRRRVSQWTAHEPQRYKRESRQLEDTRPGGRLVGSGDGA
jgi:hypothetical protein